MSIGMTWWTEITNTNRFINSIVSELSLGRSVIVNFPGRIPWADDFRDTIENELNQYADERGFDVVSAPKPKKPKNSSEKRAPAKSPGEFIFEQYCSPNEKNKFYFDQSYEAFMAKEKNTVLNTKYVYMTNITTETADDWVRSVDSYTGFFSEGEEYGIFLLVNIGTCSAENLDHVVCINYTDFISEYDCLMLCLTLVCELKCSAKEKQYIAEFASTVSDGNYEIAGCLAEKGSKLIEDPYITVQDVFREHKVSYTSLSKTVDSALWAAQTKLVFPVVEAYRKYFSEKYEQNLKKQLPFTDNLTGERIIYPNELEIGHLFFLSDKYHFADPDDHLRLKVIKDARNDSSHWNVIPLDRFREIIG